MLNMVIWRKKQESARRVHICNLGTIIAIHAIGTVIVMDAQVCARAYAVIWADAVVGVHNYAAAAALIVKAVPYPPCYMTFLDMSKNL